MNPQAFNFNESMLKQLTTEQQEGMLKSKGIKKCPKCKYKCFQLFAICPKCNFVFQEHEERWGKIKMDILNELKNFAEEYRKEMSVNVYQGIWNIIQSIEHERDVCEILKEIKETK